MNRRVKQTLAGVLLACMMLLVLPAGQLVSMAASAKITFSDPNGEVGQEIMVNMKITSGDGSLGSADIMLAYDASALEFIEGNSVEGGAGSLRARGGPDPADLANIVFAMRFRMLKPGASQITIVSQEVYDSNSQAVTISHQGSATVTAASAGAETEGGLLSSLAVAPGTLVPEFSPWIDSYSVHVGLDVEQVAVEALAGEGAQVAVEGSEGLQMGENTITIKVTAPDGVTVKNYTISVNKSEGGESSGSLGEGVVEGVSLEAAAKAITILAPEEGAGLPEGFAQTTIDIDGYKVTGWIWASETEHQYCIFYAMNAAGEKNFYRYDLTEKTIQRYFIDPAAQSGYTKEETEGIIGQYNSLLEDYKIRMYIIFALAAVAVVLLIMVIVLLATKNSGKDTGNSRYGEREEEEPVGRKRAISHEERYLRGEEPEEEPVVRRVVSVPQEPKPERRAPVEEDDFEIVENPQEMEMAAAQVEYTGRKLSPRQKEEEWEAEPVPEEGDDFEFMDIDE